MIGSKYAPNGRATMKVVVTRGNGGYDMLDYCDVPVPQPTPDEVLLQVLAAGVNNTSSTLAPAGTPNPCPPPRRLLQKTASAENVAAQADGGWNAATPFPFTQGTDCCGRVVAAGQVATSAPSDHVY